MPDFRVSFRDLIRDNYERLVSPGLTDAMMLGLAERLPDKDSTLLRIADNVQEDVSRVVEWLGGSPFQVRVKYEKQRKERGWKIIDLPAPEGDRVLILGARATIYYATLNPEQGNGLESYRGGRIDCSQGPEALRMNREIWPGYDPRMIRWGLARFAVDRGLV